MKLTITALAVLTGLALITGPPSRALAGGIPCADAKIVLQAVKEHAGEVPAFSGMAAGGGALIITVSATGSWTMFVSVGPNLCAAAAGEAFKPDAVKPEKSPTALPGLQPNGLILIAR